MQLYKVEVVETDENMVDSYKVVTLFLNTFREEINLLEEINGINKITHEYSSIDGDIIAGFQIVKLLEIVSFRTMNIGNSENYFVGVGDRWYLVNAEDKEKVTIREVTDEDDISILGCREDDDEMYSATISD